MKHKISIFLFFEWKRGSNLNQIWLVEILIYPSSKTLQRVASSIAYSQMLMYTDACFNILHHVWSSTWYYLPLSTYMYCSHNLFVLNKTSQFKRHLIITIILIDVGYTANTMQLAQYRYRIRRSIERQFNLTCYTLIHILPHVIAFTIPVFS